jgi:hypothetical protein
MTLTRRFTGEGDWLLLCLTGHLFWDGHLLCEGHLSQSRYLLFDGFFSWDRHLLQGRLFI